METTEPRTGVVPHGRGEVLLDGPLGATLLAGRADTGGSAAFVLHPMAPRTLGPPAHTHAFEDEWSYVLEGVVGMQIGDRPPQAGQGDLVRKPGDGDHALCQEAD